MTDAPYASLQHVTVHAEDHVLHIRLNTPDNGNLVSEGMLDDLLAALSLLNDLDDIKVLVLSAEGDDFSLGGDRGEFQSMLEDEPTASGIRRCGEKGLRVCQAITGSHAVTIARLQGKVIGAGFALAVACDLRVGTEDTTFRLPEVALGLPVAWGSMLPRLRDQIGSSRAAELIFTGRRFDAAKAETIGLLHEVTSREALDDTVQQWTNRLTRARSAGLRVTKRLMQAYDTGNQLGVPGLLDAELMASVVAGAARSPQQPPAESLSATPEAPAPSGFKRLLGGGRSAR